VSPSKDALKLARLHGVPDLPPHYLPREEVLAGLKQKLLAGCANVSITRQSSAVGVQGMGGIGKSVLAAALARDSEVRQAFPDGIYWLTLGQKPDVLVLQNQLLRQLTGSKETLATDQEAKDALREALEGRTALLAIDDVWTIEQAHAFSVAAPPARLLITTRNNEVLVGVGAEEHRVDVLWPSDALKMLAEWVGEKSPAKLPLKAAEVARKCGYLPLAVALCGAVVSEGTPWLDVGTALDAAELEFLDHPYGSVMKSLKVSVDALVANEAQRYLELAVFPKNESVPEQAVLTLWNHTGQLEERNSRKMLTKLRSKALLRIDGEVPQRKVSLHDLQHDYLRASRGDLTGLHVEILEAYRRKCPSGWASGPNDGYFLERLSFHMAGAKKWNELTALLLNSEFIRAKLGALSYRELALDFQWRERCLASLTSEPERNLFSRLDQVSRQLSGFFNRERETELLEEQLASGRVNHIFITGPPGIGKTTLLNHLWIRSFRDRVLFRCDHAYEFAERLPLQIVATLSPLVGEVTEEFISRANHPNPWVDPWVTVSDLVQRYARPLWILIDELDVIREGNVNTGIFRVLPRNLCFVWGSRIGDVMLRVREAVPDAVVFKLENFARHDMQRWLDHLGKVEVRSWPPDLAKQIIEQSDGSPLMTLLILRHFADGLDLRDLPYSRSLSTVLRLRLEALFAARVPEALVREIAIRIVHAGKANWDDIKPSAESAYELELLKQSGIFTVELHENEVLIGVPHDAVAHMLRVWYGL
jgi:DNA polymerase III delta prime subunit